MLVLVLMLGNNLASWNASALLGLAVGPLGLKFRSRVMSHLKRKKIQANI